MEWIYIGDIDDIPKLGARVVETEFCNVAVFRNTEDEVFALKDQCPHKGGPLSQGIVFDRRVTCPLHNWVISLESGEATGPDTGCTMHFPTKLENGKIYLQLLHTESEGCDSKHAVEA